jgi:glycosyltransferase involved in cell wall biosynthesis
MRKRLCFVVSSPMSVVSFLLPHIKLLSEEFNISIVANTTELDLLTKYGVDVKIHPIVIQRSVSFVADTWALISLIRYFRKNKFDIVQSVTPKAGLLSMVSAWVAKVPIRVHMFTGQVWVTKKGLIRFILKSMDILMVKFSTHILVDSKSQNNFLMTEGVIVRDKSEILANGSICGVDTRRFLPSYEARFNLRHRLGIPDKAFLILYLGRLTEEKGIIDLANAFLILAAKYDNIWLAIVGSDEGSIQSSIKLICNNYIDKILFVTFTNEPESYMAASEIFCMPSYREGFGLSVIEAAACGIPSVGSRIYGLTDAIEEGITGILHQPGNINEMVNCIELFLLNTHLRRKMGDAARDRVERLFNQEYVTAALNSFYQGILDKSGE